MESISLYCKVSNQKRESQKQNLSLRISEGNKGMTVEEYIFIAINIFQISKKEHVFAHCYTFYWEVIVTSLCFLLAYLLLIYMYIYSYIYIYICVRNITKRANNCVHFKIIHIQMVFGCLVLKFAKSKGYKIRE